MKELLKITHIKDGVCSAEVKADNDHELEMAVASLLSVMDQDDKFAKLVVCACLNYIGRRGEVAKLNQIAMAQGKIKTQN